MKKVSKSLLLFILGIFAFVPNIFAESKNEAILNFGDAIIHDGYVEYSKIGKLQIFKGDDLVVDISNNMTIDLNGAEYKFVVTEIPTEGTGGVVGNAPVKLNINNWYYPMTTIVGEDRSTFKLDSSKFSGTLYVKLERTRVVINTKVENVYNDTSSKGIIDLTDGKEYIIDFSKTDELTEGLELFVDLDKTLYYKRDYNGLLLTDNESEAVIKIVGNRSENKAILTAVNIGTKKSEVFKGLHTKYTGSKLDFVDSFDDIINETRTDYYTKCSYEFTFQYVSDKEYKFIEGANQTYTINKSKDASFRIDADYSLFEDGGKVYVDGVLLDSNNYTSKSGSTLITLNDTYLKTLSVGEHILRVVFTDEKEVSTKFIIANDNNEVEIPSLTPEIENPNTGDKAVTYIIMGIASFVVLAGIGMLSYRRKQTN